MILLKPIYNLLLTVSVILFITAFLITKKVLNINLTDTVYLIPFRQIFLAVAVYLSILWLLYSYTIRYLFSQKLYSWHIVITVVLLFIILLAALWSNFFIEKIYSANISQAKIELSAITGNVIVFACITLTCIQLLYPINLIIGLIKNKKR